MKDFQLLTSCLSWVWRCRVSGSHYAEEWTSLSDTWVGMQSVPVGSENWVKRKQPLFIAINASLTTIGCIETKLTDESIHKKKKKPAITFKCLILNKHRLKWKIKTCHFVLVTAWHEDASLPTVDLSGNRESVPLFITLHILVWFD